MQSQIVGIPLPPPAQAPPSGPVDLIELPTILSPLAELADSNLPAPTPLAAEESPRTARAKALSLSARIYVNRACAIWPRLDRRSLRHCADDVDCMARVISRRTRLPERSIVALLRGGR